MKNFFISLVCFISAFSANGMHSEQKRVDVLYDTNSCPVNGKDALIINSISHFKAENFKNQKFQLNPNYCLLNRSTGDKYGVSFPSFAEYKELDESYRAAYQTLNNINDKANFIEHFLYNVTRQYLVLNSWPVRSDKTQASVVFSFNNKANKTVYIRLNLFRNDELEDRIKILQKLEVYQLKQINNQTVQDSLDLVFKKRYHSNLNKLNGEN